jgi:VanZ family protein
MRALRLLPPLAWTGLIFWLSTDRWSAGETGAMFLPWLARLLPWAVPAEIELIHWLVRKSAHALQYGVLAALWSLALGDPVHPVAWRRWVVPLGLSIVTASLDELAQGTTSARGASPVDVLLDAAGAGVALIWRTGGLPAFTPRLTGALLWFAAVAGTALIVLDWSLGVPTPWLWMSTPAAWIALALWRRRSRHR